MAEYICPYTVRSREVIAAVLGWNRVTPKELFNLDPDVRMVIKKDLEGNCPFERRGLAYRIWQRELHILFGIEARQAVDPDHIKPAIQRDLF